MHLVYGVHTYIMVTMVHTHQVRCVLGKHEKMYMYIVHVARCDCKTYYFCSLVLFLLLLWLHHWKAKWYWINESEINSNWQNSLANFKKLYFMLYKLTYHDTKNTSYWVVRFLQEHSIHYSSLFLSFVQLELAQVGDNLSRWGVHYFSSSFSHSTRWWMQQTGPHQYKIPERWRWRCPQ